MEVHRAWEAEGVAACPEGGTAASREVPSAAVHASGLEASSRRAAGASAEEACPWMEEVVVAHPAGRVACA